MVSTSEEGELDSVEIVVHSVVEISVEDVSVIEDGSDEAEDVEIIVDSLVEGIVSVSVLEDGSVDEMEVEGSVDDSVEISVVKSVDIEEVSDNETVSVVESEVEISSVEESVVALDE